MSARTLVIGLRIGVRHVAKLKCRIYEVGIPYGGRTYEEGKKIGWRDGVRALWCIVKYNLRR